MKKILSKIIFTLLTFTLFAKICVWIFNYSEEVKHVIILIGAAYMLMSFKIKKEINKSVFVVCGAYLIIMNFIELNIMLKVIGMLSVVLPMLVSEFSGEKIKL